MNSIIDIDFIRKLGVNLFSNLENIEKICYSYYGVSKVLLVASIGATKRGSTHEIEKLIGTKNIIIYDKVKKNPTMDDIRIGLKEIFPNEIALIVAFGGGSVIDTAKIFSCYYNNSSFDNLLFNRNNCIPVLAIPTTIGSGSEVTPFATIWDMNNKMKISVPVVYPRFIVVDPSFTLGLSFDSMLYIILDSISHFFDSLWNLNKTSRSEYFALKAGFLFNRYLEEFLNDFNNSELRIFLQYASILSGLAISITRTSISHAISYPLTINYNVPHGLGCAFVLPELFHKAKIEDWSLSSTEEVIGVIRIINLLNLDLKIRNYISLQDALSITDRVLLNKRSNNYLYRIDEVEIRSILTKSIYPLKIGKL